MKQSAIHIKGHKPPCFRPPRRYLSLRTALQHELSPLHVWCRAIKLGAEPKAAKRLCARYERLYNAVLG